MESINFKPQIINNIINLWMIPLFFIAGNLTYRIPTNCPDQNNISWQYQEKSVQPCSGQNTTQDLSSQETWKMFHLSRLHRDAAAFASALTSADNYLAQVQNDLNANDLLLITATHADDPASEMTPTREYLPLIAYSPSRPSVHALGIRRTLADVGATVLENFGLAGHAAGHSFLNEITQ